MWHKWWRCRWSRERPSRELTQAIESSIWNAVYRCCQASLLNVPLCWSPSSIIHAMALSACLDSRWVIQFTCSPIPMAIALLGAMISTNVNVSIGQCHSMRCKSARTLVTSPATAIARRVCFARCPASPTTASIAGTGVNVNATLASSSWKPEALPHFPGPVDGGPIPLQASVAAFPWIDHFGAWQISLDEGCTEQLNALLIYTFLSACHNNILKSAHELIVRTKPGPHALHQGYFFLCLPCPGSPQVFQRLIMAACE